MKALLSKVKGKVRAASVVLDTTSPERRGVTPDARQRLPEPPLQLLSGRLHGQLNQQGPSKEGRMSDAQASLDYKQRLQQLFFPEGIAFDGNRFTRTAVTAPLFRYLAPSESADERVVSRDGIEPSTRRLRVCCSAN
jgi:hypothetical protein